LASSINNGKVLARNRGTPPTTTTATHPSGRTSSKIMATLSFLPMDGWQEGGQCPSEIRKVWKKSALRENTLLSDSKSIYGQLHL